MQGTWESRPSVRNKIEEGKCATKNVSYYLTILISFNFNVWCGSKK